MAAFACLLVSVLLAAFTAVRMLCFVESEMVPCSRLVSSQATIWSGVPAVTTGEKSSVVVPLICPYTMELMKFTRARLVLVLKMANSGPFSVVWGIRLEGGKKLNTLPELKRLCDMVALKLVKPEPSVNLIPQTTLNGPEF